MTIDRANEIVDGVETVLTSGVQVVGAFIPLSLTTATSRTELAHAFFIVTAHVFRAAKRRGMDTGSGTDFAEFARGASGSLSTVFFMRPCLPDPELRLIAKLPPHSREYSQECSRLEDLAMNDGATSLETVESFVKFLHSLDTRSDDYWPTVYRRIGILCPTDLVPGAAPPQAPPKRKQWWRFW